MNEHAQASLKQCNGGNFLRWAGIVSITEFSSSTMFLYYNELRTNIIFM